ncbi:MAG: Nif3-like dinuclear metal center hexameric protein [Aestuariibacter sp.]
MMQRQQLTAWFERILQPQLIKDYCPNGLQVEGKETVNKVVTGVTASKALIEKAIESQADAIVVHHGYFWKGEPQSVTGMKKQRLKLLLEHDINLFAYHLPLDVHPEVGNNAMLGKILGLTDIQALPGQKPEGIVMTGRVTGEKLLTEFCDELMHSLSRKALVEESGSNLVSKVAWCTGGGQSFIEAVIEHGVDTFISGEVSEQTIHTARECAVNFIAAGHHATERYGVKALGEKLAEETGLEVSFIDVPNPA